MAGSDSRAAADGQPVGERRHNSGRPDGLTAKVNQAMETAPEDASLREVASAAWVAYERRADPADCWAVVLADSRECSVCGLPHLRAAGNSTLSCVNCGSAFQVGRVP